MNSILRSLRPNATRRIVRSSVTSFHPPHLCICPIHTTPALHKEDINNLKQGHVVNPENIHPQDPQSQSTRGGFKARKDKSNKSIDAARESEDVGKDNMPKHMGKGNPERIGFVEQVGGASGTARKFENDRKSPSN